MADICQMGGGGGSSYQTDLISPLSLVLGVRNGKTAYRKSWPENLLPVSNLTFDPCFKVKCGHRTKKLLYLQQ